MLLELADGNNQPQKIFVPGVNGKRSWEVDANFFDKLDNYEFSGVFSELLEYNPSLDFNRFVTDRNIRRRKLGLPPTNYNPTLSGHKFGDWIARTGKKIESFFQPTKKPDQPQPIPLIQPDGTIVTVVPPTTQPQESGFTTLVKGVANALGLTTPVVPPGYYQPPVDNTAKYLTYAAVGGLGYMIVKKLMK